MQNMTEATDYSFDAEVLKCDVPVIADFGAAWCGPCKQLDPILADVANSYGEHIKVVKIDLDDSPQTASTYEVLSIPTMIVFKNGVPVERIKGVVSKKQILEKLEPFLDVPV